MALDGGGGLSEKFLDSWGGEFGPGGVVAGAESVAESGEWGRAGARVKEGNAFSKGFRSDCGHGDVLDDRWRFGLGV